jgi:hypothetical protein
MPRKYRPEEILMFLTDSCELELDEAQEFVADLVNYYDTRRELKRCDLPVPLNK